MATRALDFLWHLGQWDLSPVIQEAGAWRSPGVAVLVDESGDDVAFFDDVLDDRRFFYRFTAAVPTAIDWSHG